MKQFNKLTMLRLSLKLFLLTSIFFSPVTPQSPIKEWETKKADIFFLVDTSSSIWIVDYHKQLTFIANLVSDMNIGPNYTRVGVGLYSDKMTLYIPLNNTMTKAELMKNITLAPFLHGDGYISRGIDGLRKQGMTPAVWRSDVAHASVLFTDDSSRYLQWAYDNATLAKKDGTYMFTVSVGRRVPRSELALLSSDPSSEYIFEVDNFDLLDSIRTSLSTKLSRVEYMQDDKATCGEDKHMDVLFLFDEYAYGKFASQKIKSFLQNISHDLSINSRHVRVGVVSKTCHTGEIKLIQHLKRETFIESLNVDDGPDITSLLQHVRRNVFVSENGARDYAIWRMVAFLHGDLSKNIEVYREFMRNKYNHIEVFIVYTNTDYNKKYVESLATDADHVLYLTSVDELLNRKADFSKMFCKDI